MVTPSPSPDPNALAHVESVVRRSGSSFYWAMRWLPTEKRRAMYGIYAFCRQVDDIVDGTGRAEEKRAQLGQWGGEIERLYGEQPRNPLVRALLGPVEDFGLHEEDFRAIIDGMKMDADDRVRIKDMDELSLYCERVACAVGRLCICVFGLDNDKGKELAFSLGQALQLTNILRDIPEDAERNRLYIPENLLRSYEVASENLPSVLNHPAFPKVCDTLACVAERRFQQAENVIAQCDREKIRPAIMMMEIYRRIFKKLRHRGWKYLHLPVKISKPRKIWIALRYGFF